MVITLIGIRQERRHAHTHSQKKRTCYSPGGVKLDEDEVAAIDHLVKVGRRQGDDGGSGRLVVRVSTHPHVLNDTWEGESTYNVLIDICEGQSTCTDCTQQSLWEGESTLQYALNDD